MTRLATLERSFPTLLMLVSPFRWLSKSRRRIGIAAIVTLSIIASPLVWWAMQLFGLPDIGDPFDIAAFQNSIVADERNAFVLYESRGLSARGNGTPAALADNRANGLARWPDAPPNVRRWVEENREALATYRQGTERPDAFDRATGFDRQSFKTIGALSRLHLMVLLEASRREEQSDMAAHGDGTAPAAHPSGTSQCTIPAIGAIRVVRWHRELRNRLMTWATDPRTTPQLLRRALDDMVACDSLAVSEVDSLKSSYIDVKWLLDSPANPGRRAPLARFRRFWNPNYTLSPETVHDLWNAWRFVRHEPDRSDRVIRLVTANWLAYFELPEDKRPKPDLAAVLLDLYQFGPELPAQRGRWLPRRSTAGWPQP